MSRVRTHKAHERVGFALSSIDGSSLFYRDVGPKEQTRPRACIILSDGLGCDGFAWKYLIQALSAEYRLIHWQYPGHGRSPRRVDSTRVSMADFAADLVSVLDDVQVERAVLFGHSMGVQVSLEAFRRTPERVQGLAFFCGMAENPLKTFRGTDMLEQVLPAIRYAVDRAPRVLGAIGRQVLPTKLAYLIAGQLEVNVDLVQQEELMPYLRGLSRVDPDLFLAMLAEAGRHTAVDLLPTIDVPTLVIAGDTDGFTPPELSKQLADSIPGAELTIVKNGTHTAPIEHPQLVCQTAKDFLDRRIATENA